MPFESYMDEHYHLIELIQKYYKEGNYNKCEEYCIQDIRIYPHYISQIKSIYGEDEVKQIRLISFETLIKVYEKQRRYDEAISVCKEAINYDIKDGTKGGFKARLNKMEKLRLNPPEITSFKKKTQDKLPVQQSQALFSNPTPELDWHISVSFNKSASENFAKAIVLAQNSSYKYLEIEVEGQKIHQAIFTSDRQSYINFIQLYELVAGWKSSFVMINGKLTDRKIVSGLNYCYGDKCRSGRSDFCFGASEMTENPFGCHRLQISACNNPWWSFGVKKGNKVVLNKTAMRERIDEYSMAYRGCPDFDYEYIIRVLEALPNELKRTDLYKFSTGELKLSIKKIPNDQPPNMSKRLPEAEQSNIRGFFNKIFKK